MNNGCGVGLFTGCEVVIVLNELVVNWQWLGGG